MFLIFKLIIFLYLLDATKIFTEDELMRIKNILSTNNIMEGLKKLLNNCLWMNDKEITDALKEPLMRACAWYLYREKRRNYALNAVG